MSLLDFDSTADKYKIIRYICMRMFINIFV
jgi:hypothetical protein